MIWWLFGFGAAGAALMWWKHKPLAADPYKQAHDRLVDYGEECGQEAIDYQRECKDAIDYVEKLYQRK